MSNTRIACIGASLAAITAIIVTHFMPTVPQSFLALSVGAAGAVALFGK